MAEYRGTPGDDMFVGGPQSDTAYGFGGNDLLDGGGGDDITDGGTGDDFHYIDSARDRVIERAREGLDRVFALVSYALTLDAEVEQLTTFNAAGTAAIDLAGSNTDNFIYANAGANTLLGRGGNDFLVGLGGNDTLDGGAGDDITAGGIGNDFHFIDSAGDRVIEKTGEGTDRVFALVSYALAIDAEVEQLTTLNAAGVAAIDLTGSDSDNFIYANDGANALVGRGGNDFLVGLGGNDSLDGGTGDDITAGGTGDDFHYVDSAGDRVIENVGEGNDRVFAYASYALELDTEVEMLTTINAAAATAINLTGSNTDNFIYANQGSNQLSGRGGDDFLIGLGGNDFLDGGAGIDITAGGTGDDFHYVNNALDRVIENVGEGSDLIFTTVSYTIPEDAEVESLYTRVPTGTAPLILTGNRGANAVFGNAGANTLLGRGGDDRLDGGLGADVTDGGSGDDTHIVDNALDRVIERAGEGFDRLLTSVSYVLAEDSFVEALYIDPAGTPKNVTLTGNSKDNFLFGNNNADNRLIGGAGNDVLDGGGQGDVTDGGPGDDIHYLDYFDGVIERPGEGYDRVYTTFGQVTLDPEDEVELLAVRDPLSIGFVNLVGSDTNNAIYGGAGPNQISGRGGDDLLFGLAGDDVLYGNAGRDSLDGGLGSDYLNGGEDVDLFQFTTALGPNNIDTIDVLQIGTDKLMLDKAIFTQLPIGALAPDAFHLGAVAGDAGDRIIFDRPNNAIYYDPDGTGPAAMIQFAATRFAEPLSAAEFIVF